MLPLAFTRYHDRSLNLLPPDERAGTSELGIHCSGTLFHVYYAVLPPDLLELHAHNSQHAYLTGQRTLYDDVTHQP